MAASPTESRSSRRLKLIRRLALGASLCLVTAGACKKKSDDSDDAFGPTTLEVTGFQNADGDEFERDAKEVSLACDPRLTVRLGPSTNSAGILDNWLFRVPGSCEQEDQCGYVHLELLDAEGELVLEEKQAVLNPVVSIADEQLREVQTVKVTLISGNTGEPYVEGSEVVSDKTALNLSADCQGMGGMGGGGIGGAGGMGGTSSL